MKYVVYTAILGGKDDLKPPREVDAGITYLCFTDTPQRFQGRSAWRLVPVEGSNDPVRQARRIKIMAQEHVQEYDFSLWIDGKVRIWRRVRPLLEKYRKEKLMAWQHWQRNCVYTESRACIRMKKDSFKLIQRQMNAYRKEGYPANNGLIRSEVLLRSHNDPWVAKVMQAWWEQVYTRSRRDQLSFPYVAWKQRFQYTRNRSQHEFNKYFKVYKHLRR